MGGGNQAPPTQTTTATPSPQAQQLLGAAMPTLMSPGIQPMTLPSFPMTAGFTPAQTQGQNMALAAAGPQADIVGTAGRGNQFLAGGDVLRPSSNPALQDWINAATLPIKQTYAEDVFPQITQGATAAGQMGGSRQGIAEGIAGRGEEQAVGATTANIANQGYLAGLQAMLGGQQIAPAVAGAQTMPATTTSAVGDVQQAMNQQQINEQIMRYMFPQQQQQVPFDVALEQLAAAGAIPGGTTQTVGSVPQSTLAQNLMGGGAIAAGLLGNQGLSALPGLASSAASGIGSMGSTLASLLPFALL